MTRKEKNNQLFHDLIDYEKDLKYFFKESKNLKEKYRGKVILIKNEEVKIVGDTIEEVKKKASQLGIDVAKSVVEFIPKEDITLIV
jgi:hypothetical protein